MQIWMQRVLLSIEWGICQLFWCRATKAVLPKNQLNFHNAWTNCIHSIQPELSFLVAWESRTFNYHWKPDVMIRLKAKYTICTTGSYLLCVKTVHLKCLSRNWVEGLAITNNETTILFFQGDINNTFLVLHWIFCQLIQLQDVIFPTQSYKWGLPLIWTLSICEQIDGWLWQKRW